MVRYTHKRARTACGTQVSVVSCAVNVVCELARKNPANFLSLAPIFFKLLTASSNNWYCGVLTLGYSRVLKGTLGTRGYSRVLWGTLRVLTLRYCLYGTVSAVLSLGVRQGAYSGLLCGTHSSVIQGKFSTAYSSALWGACDPRPPAQDAN
jgi:hypothetical protein